MHGAPGLMRLPGRLHITWQDDRTLEIEPTPGRKRGCVLHPATKSGRCRSYLAGELHRGVGRCAGRERCWRATLGIAARRDQPVASGLPAEERRSLQRERGVDRHFDLHPGPGGSTWITLTAVVNDPSLPGQEFITSTDFRKEPDGSKWNPTPCGAD